MKIQKAERKQVKIKLAITGPSGAGKTMSSLMLAKGLVPDGRVLVIDSEDGSSNLYADNALLNGAEFDVIEIDAPYTITKYLKALDMGIQEKYDVIIIDSISHAWAGEGGLLEKKNGLDSRGGSNSYTNWASITKEQELFKSRMVHCPSHLIVTMRSKQDYVMGVNEKGKQAPQKVGLAPIQRDGMEYEFTTVFDIGMDHQFSVSKDRTGLFDGSIEKMTEKTGRAIKEWLMSGKGVPMPLSDAVIMDLSIKVIEFFEGGWVSEAHKLITELSPIDKKSMCAHLNPEIINWLKSLSQNPMPKEVQ